MRATSVLRRAAVKADRVTDTITLDHEARHRRRFAMIADGGTAFLLDLDRATALDDGDALKLEDGRLVQVKAAPEKLIEITTDNPVRLTKVAWHVGNRHVAAELTTDAIYIAHDHVLLEMVRGLGATAREVERPFRPERGAYEGHGHAHGHDHGHAHDHGHQAHDHGEHGHHAHDHAHHEHKHGPDCGCGHDHHGHDHRGHEHQGHEHQGHGHRHG